MPEPVHAPRRLRPLAGPGGRRGLLLLTTALIATAAMARRGPTAALPA